MFLLKYRGFLDGSAVKNPPVNAQDAGLIPVLGRSPGEKEMATHSSSLVWEIQRTEEPVGLHFRGGHKEWGMT